LNWVGLVLILFGTGYLVYSIIFRKRVTYYNSSVEIVKGRENDFFKLQLYFSLFNSTWFILLGLIIVKLNLTNPIIVLSPVLFHFINLLLQIVSRRKGYIKK